MRPGLTLCTFLQRVVLYYCDFLWSQFCVLPSVILSKILLTKQSFANSTIELVYASARVSFNSLGAVIGGPHTFPIQT